MRGRILILFLMVLGLWSLLIIRAASLQLFPDQRLVRMHENQYKSRVHIEPRRGSLLDRTGRELAVSVRKYSIFADPELLPSPRKTSRNLARILNQDSKQLYQLLKDREKRFVWIERRISDGIRKQVEALGERGLGSVEEWQRVYPNGTLMASTIGMVGAENQGLEGLELQFDSELKGQSREFLVRRDALGRPLVGKDLLFSEDLDGKDVRLSIDLELQYSLESELQKTKNEFQADAALGVVLDAKTSAVLAIGNVPGYDVNEARKVGSQIRKNKSIVDVFEPGSTLKTIVLAGALEQGALGPNTQLFCENGLFRIGNRTIREAEAHEKFQHLTATEILAFSSNIGASKIALKMGDASLFDTLTRFGFGQKTGIDFPGEARGILHDLPWSQHSVATKSFGHGIAASALQIANAYATIANGGMFNAPYFLDSVLDLESEHAESKPKPKPIRRVLSEDIAKTLRMMLVTATADGSTGVSARIPGYLVAGKTGTAQKVRLNGPGYEPGQYVSSFAGFLPAQDPRFVIYVAVDNPRKAYYGSQVAAPLFSKIAAFAMNKAGIPPQETDLATLSLAHRPIQNLKNGKWDFRDQTNSANSRYENTSEQIIDLVEEVRRDFDNIRESNKPTDKQSKAQF